MTGGGASSSQRVGRHRTSPSLSIPIILTTRTGGRSPTALTCRPLRFRCPSFSNSFRIAFKAIRAPPRILKARAISLLPTGVGLYLINSRICRFEIGGFWANAVSPPHPHRPVPLWPSSRTSVWPQTFGCFFSWLLSSWRLSSPVVWRL